MSKVCEGVVGRVDRLDLRKRHLKPVADKQRRVFACVLEETPRRFEVRKGWTKSGVSGDGFDGRKKIRTVVGARWRLDAHSPAGPEAHRQTRHRLVSVAHPLKCGIAEDGVEFLTERQGFRLTRPRNRYRRRVRGPPRSIIPSAGSMPTTLPDVATRIFSSDCRSAIPRRAHLPSPRWQASGRESPRRSAGQARFPGSAWRSRRIRSASAPPNDTLADSGEAMRGETS